MKKQAILALLCERYPEFSKDHLYAKILCGEVCASGIVERDPKILLARDTELELLSKRRFVSRGGEKLQHAIDTFGLSVSGAIALDAGASSGGFTDCLLQNGCSMVYAVDSGKNQLDFRLRSNPKVQCFEGCKIQDFLVQDFLPQSDFVVMDIAFRSILDLIPQALAACRRRYGVFLCKPQFEWQVFCVAQPQFGETEFEGVLEDELGAKVFSWFCGQLEQAQIEIVSSCLSPLRGKAGRSKKMDGNKKELPGAGNLEYLLQLALSAESW